MAGVALESTDGLNEAKYLSCTAKWVEFLKNANRSKRKGGTFMFPTHRQTWGSLSAVDDLLESRAVLWALPDGAESLWTSGTYSSENWNEG